jgi:hypothetical protein
VLPRGTRGRGHLPRVLEHGTQGRHFSFFLANGSVQRRRQMRISFCECHSSPRVILPRVPWVLRHSGKPLFPECFSSPSATLGEDLLPRVPDFWHSGKSSALGKSWFSRSGPRWANICAVIYGAHQVWLKSVKKDNKLVGCLSFDVAAVYSRSAASIQCVGWCVFGTC